VYETVNIKMDTKQVGWEGMDRLYLSCYKSNREHLWTR